MSRLQLIHSVHADRPPATTRSSRSPDSASANDVVPRANHLQGGASPGADDRFGIRPLDPVVQKLVEHVRVVAPVPQLVRARALARARAAMAALSLPPPAR